MITKEMIREGYEKGIVKLIMTPNGNSVVCQIGKNWFYFCSSAGYNVDTVEKYKSIVSKEEIIDEIYESLSEFPEMIGMANEYTYYEAYLREQLNLPKEEVSEQKTGSGFDYEGYRNELIGLRDHTEHLIKETGSRLERTSLESMRNAFDIAIERMEKFKN